MVTLHMIGEMIQNTMWIYTIIQEMRNYIVMTFKRGWGNRENCQNFSFPSTSDHDPWTFTMFPANYKSTDLSLNLMP